MLLLFCSELCVALNYWLLYFCPCPMIFNCSFKCFFEPLFLHFSTIFILFMLSNWNSKYARSLTHFTDAAWGIIMKSSIDISSELLRSNNDQHKFQGLTHIFERKEKYSTVKAALWPFGSEILFVFGSLVILSGTAILFVNSSTENCSAKLSKTPTLRHQSICSRLD